MVCLLRLCRHVAEIHTGVDMGDHGYSECRFQRRLVPAWEGFPCSSRLTFNCIKYQVESTRVQAYLKLGEAVGGLPVLAAGRAIVAAHAARQCGTEFDGETSFGACVENFWEGKGRPLSSAIKVLPDRFQLLFRARVIHLYRHFA